MSGWRAGRFCSFGCAVTYACNGRVVTTWRCAYLYHGRDGRGYNGGNRHGIRRRGPGSRVFGSRARRSGVLSPRRGRQDASDPGRLPDPGRLVYGRPGRFVDVSGGGCGCGGCGRGTAMRPGRRRHYFQVAAWVEQRPDAQRSGRRHETVHPTAWYHGRARVHELQDAFSVLVRDVLQNDRDAVVRSGVPEENVL